MPRIPFGDKINLIGKSIASPKVKRVHRLKASTLGMN